MKKIVITKKDAILCAAIMLTGPSNVPAVADLIKTAKHICDSANESSNWD